MNQKTRQLLNELRRHVPLDRPQHTDVHGMTWCEVFVIDANTDQESLAALFAHGVAKDRRESYGETHFKLLLGHATFVETTYSGTIRFDDTIKQSVFFRTRAGALHWIRDNRENAQDRCAIKTRVIQFFEEDAT